MKLFEEHETWSIAPESKIQTFLLFKQYKNQWKAYLVETDQ